MVHHGNYAFENSRIINLDKFTGRRLLYWVGMSSNSFEIKKFIVTYIIAKWNNGSEWDKECLMFWLPIFKREGLLK
jgi:hypothetical protein